MKQYSWERGPMGRAARQSRPMVDLSAETANLPPAERRQVVDRLKQSEPDLAALIQGFGRSFGRVQLSVDPDTAAQVLQRRGP